MNDYLMIISGLVLLFLGGEALIRGAVSLARNFGLSKLLVSSVIVGFGTSMPEMTVSVGAALKNSPEIAVGNVVGSNIANILLIVSIAVLIHPVLIKGQAVRRDALMMVASSVLLCGLALYGSLGFVCGLLMFLALVAYVAWCYSQDRKTPSETPAHIDEDIEGTHLSTLGASLYSLLGLCLLVWGAYFLVEGAVALARHYGLSEAVIGLTIVAVGTSLPELATSIVAAYRRHGDVIVGNILGSNIFNILSILGITSMVQTIPLTGQIASVDVWIMLAVALVFAVPLWIGALIGRTSAVVMLLAYIAYTAWLYNP